jgi:hypothetical protein
MSIRIPIHAERHRFIRTMALAVFCAAAALVGTTGASASAAGMTSTTATTSSTSDSSGGGASTAVVTPLLKMFVFGNTIGLPLACNDAGSVVSIIGAQTQSSKVLSPLIVELDKNCSQLSSEGNGYLQQAIAQSQALSLVNPLVDPFIADLAGGLTTIGTQYGPSLSPFGPTVAGLGGTVAFFEGA